MGRLSQASAPQISQVEAQPEAVSSASLDGALPSFDLSQTQRSAVRNERQGAADEPQPALNNGPRVLELSRVGRTAPDVSDTAVTQASTFSAVHANAWVPSPEVSRERFDIYTRAREIHDRFLIRGEPVLNAPADSWIPGTEGPYRTLHVVSSQGNHTGTIFVPMNQDFRKGSELTIDQLQKHLELKSTAERYARGFSQFIDRQGGAPESLSDRHTDKISTGDLRTIKREILAGAGSLNPERQENLAALIEAKIRERGSMEAPRVWEPSPYAHEPQSRLLNGSGYQVMIQSGRLGEKDTCTVMLQQASLDGRSTLIPTHSFTVPALDAESSAYQESVARGLQSYLRR